MKTSTLASARIETARLVLESFVESASEAWNHLDFDDQFGRPTSYEIAALLDSTACAGVAIHKLLTTLIAAADGGSPNVIKAASAVLAAVRQLDVAAIAIDGPPTLASLEAVA